MCAKLNSAAVEMTEKIKAATIDVSRLVFSKPIGRRSFNDAPLNSLPLAGRKITPPGVDQPINLNG
jgi:hypothetical protein